MKPQKKQQQAARPRRRLVKLLTVDQLLDIVDQLTADELIALSNATADAAGDHGYLIKASEWNSRR